MKRLLLLALLSILLCPPSAAGDGCPPEQCGVRALSVPGAPRWSCGPYAGTEAYDVTTARRRFTPDERSGARGSRWPAPCSWRRNPNGRTRIHRFTRRRAGSSCSGAAALLALSASLSADGRRAALTEATSYRGRPRLVVLDLATGRTEEATLRGSFEAEAVSNDGRRLFVIQYLRGGYRVRVYDLVRARAAARRAASA